jgi:predicted RND superfamily exporter protein
MKDNELLAIKQTTKDLMKENAEKQRQLNKKAKEIEDLSHQLDMISHSQEKKYLDEISLLKVRYYEMEKCNKELENNNVNNDHRLTSLLEQLKEKYSSQLLSLESKLKNENEKMKNLLAKTR